MTIIDKLNDYQKEGLGQEEKPEKEPQPETSEKEYQDEITRISTERDEYLTENERLTTENTRLLSQVENLQKKYAPELSEEREILKELESRKPEIQKLIIDSLYKKVSINNSGYSECSKCGRTSNNRDWLENHECVKTQTEKILSEMEIEIKQRKINGFNLTLSETQKLKEEKRILKIERSLGHPCPICRTVEMELIPERSYKQGFFPFRRKQTIKSFYLCPKYESHFVAPATIGGW